MKSEQEIEKGLQSCADFLCGECPYQYLDDKEYSMRCIHTLVEDANKLYYKRNKTLEKIAALFEEDFVYYQGWALDKWYEIKDILEEEYWED